MNARTMALLGAGLLLAVGLVLTVRQWLAPAPPVQTVSVALSAHSIPPYTVITRDMIAPGEPLTAAETRQRAAYPVRAVAGLMTTGHIGAGELITGHNARPVRRVRFAEDLGLEIVSFQAPIDRLVGGQLRPGHRINLYGYAASGDESFTALLASGLWVVDISAGGQPAVRATPQPDPVTGELTVLGADRDRPGTLVTLAVRPETAVGLIHALGAQGLAPWVTLAANRHVPLGMPARPTATEMAQTPALPPDGVPPLAPTPTSLPAVPDPGLGGAAEAQR